MDAREVWYGQSIRDRLARTALTPLSWLYAGGWQTYLALYRKGLKEAKEPHRPVLCVGNLVVGGSGKSPLTIHLAEVLRQIGRDAVVSASGYGSPRAESAQVAPEGPLDPAEWGDEPAMIRWLLPDAPLIVGRNRVRAAELCHEFFPRSVMLMDDGFQHLPLRKHVSIVLDDPLPSNGRCLPAGPYREPRRNRRRADLVLPGQHEIVEESWLEDPESGFRFDEPPRDFSVLCALGQPAKLLRSLPGDARVALLLPDHDPLSEGTLFRSLPEELPVVVTAKDWVKLRRRPDVRERRFLIARHTVRVEPADAFQRWLRVKLDEFEAS
ncbi:MAG TPA: tetraacyldisaccharide 4'-kinase [Fimbriimonas sp.]